MGTDSLHERIEQTAFCDTHEHLLEETTRLRGPGSHRLVPCSDAALLFHHYGDDDLHSAGMPSSLRERSAGCIPRKRSSWWSH